MFKKLMQFDSYMSPAIVELIRLCLLKEEEGRPEMKFVLERL